MIETSVCLVCGSTPISIPYFESNDWIVLRCSSCSFAWVVDLHNQPESTGFDWDIEVVTESQKRMRLYIDRMARIEKYFPAPRNWLDIGCGGGGMLQCARKAGYNVEGIELSPSASTISERLGITIHKKILRDALPDLQFDTYGVISYFHVLEHVFDPMAELLTAKQKLGDNSILVVEVPFFDAFSWKILHQKHRHFYRGHRSYFNDKSLSKLLHRAGYTILSWEKVPHYMTIGWLLMRLKLTKMSHFFPQWLLNEKPVRVDLGDMLMMVAKKAV